MDSHRPSSWAQGILTALLGTCSGSIGLGLAVAVEAPEPVELRTEHVDLRVQYAPENEGHPLSLVIRDEDRGINHTADTAVLVIGEAGRLTLPGDFPPLGSAGEELWVAPQTQDARLPYLGFSAEGLPSVLGTRIEIRLLAVEGPGHFMAWQADPFGGLDVRMNTRDGISDADHTDPIVGSHEHFNFGFTTNGIYRVTFQVSARRTGEETNILSEPTPVVFHVEPIPAPVETPFRQWQMQNWPAVSDPAVTGPGVDPDADGHSNAEEYALGTDPKRSDLPPSGVSSVKIIRGPQGAGGVIQASTLVSRTDLGLALVGAEQVSGPWIRRSEPAATKVEGPWKIWEWTLPPGASSSAGGFFRVDYVLGTTP